MSNYDGPSIYKRNSSDHPSVNKKKKQKPRFENPHKKNLPKNVQTRADIQKEAQTYMQTSPIQKRENKSPHRFKRKYIPPSMQKNNVDAIQEKNEWLHNELTKRLARDASSYLLFGDEETSTIETSRQEVTYKKPEKKIQKKQIKTNKTKLEKIEKIEKKLKAQQKKPTTGLQRSFANILEEEQEVLKNQESHLNSLFSEKKRN